jgi:curved DNA-binding protein
MSASPARIDLAQRRAALALLGLLEGADGLALKAAFRQAVKAARPDQAGGDAERFRQVIEAYRLLQRAEPAPIAALERTLPEAPPILVLTPLQALWGATVQTRVCGRRLAVQAPAGVRTGERLRLRDSGADHLVSVLIRPADGLSVLGNDLFMSWPTPPRMLEDGGRIEIETYAGARSAWVTPGLSAPARLCLPGLGLPARGGRPLGRLFVTLTPASDAPSPAEDRLLRFTKVWTPERLAA